MIYPAGCGSDEFLRCRLAAVHDPTADVIDNVNGCW